VRGRTTRNGHDLAREKKISGARALEIGLVHEIWPLHELKSQAMKLAHDLAGMPATAVNAMMSVLVNSDSKNLDELLSAERDAVVATRGTADAKEGMAAFLEKRQPVFNQDSE
jgi:enoyl-CoA hydratase